MRWNVRARRFLGAAAFGLAAWLGWARTEGPSAPPPDPTLVLDPNTAPAVVMMALPRLGPALVGRIVAERGVAPFRSIDDLDRRVKGIGPATAASLRPHLRFDSGTVVSEP